MPGNNLTANETEINCLIERAKAGEVDLAIVGSEALYRGDLSAEQLLTYIQQVKAALPSQAFIAIFSFS